MPNRTIYLTEKNLKIVEASGEGLGPYINKLIGGTLGGGEGKSETVELGSAPAEKYQSFSVISSTNTCKKCGYMLPYYKAKCKNCGGKR